MSLDTADPLSVVVAPDEFGGTLTASDAARAIADGWRSRRPQDSLRLLPQSDGGPGFIEVLAAAGAVSVRSITVRGPLGEPVDASYGVAADATVYLEAAQACGLALLGRGPDPSTAVAATTHGVGELIGHAVEAGAGRIVVGLGGSATTDGGRGAIDALGGLTVAGALLRDVELIVASDVDNPLLGPSGAAAVFGPQKGADPETVHRLESRLREWADELADVADRAGAGAAGGLGAALLALGGTRRPGSDVVGDATGRRDTLASADLVITGEGRYDAQTVRGKVVSALAEEAAGVPVIVLAGQVSGEPRIAGVVHVGSVVDSAGSIEAAIADPYATLAALAADTADQVAAVRGVMRE